VTWTFQFTGTTATGNDSASLTPGLPAGWQPGDLLVLSCQNHGGGANARTPSAPAGWIPFNGTTGLITDGNGAHHGVWYKVAEAGETDPTITYSGPGVANDSQVVKVSCYRPAAGAVPALYAVGTPSINASADQIGPIAGIAGLPAGLLLVASAGKTNDFAGSAVPDGSWTHTTIFETTTGNDCTGTLERILSWAGGDLPDLTIDDNGGTASNGVGFGVILAFSEAGPLEGSSAGAGDASGTLTARAALAGSAAGSASATGTLTDGTPPSSGLAGSAAGSASAAGSLTARAALAGASAGAASTTATLEARAALAGAAQGAAQAVAALTAAAALAGTAAGAAAGLGILTALAALAGSAQGQASASAALRDANVVPSALALVLTDASAPALVLAEASAPGLHLTDAGLPGLALAEG
jgi:hypothetical protein